MAGVFNLSSLNSNLVCDAVADPPRLPNNKILNKIPEVKPPNQDQGKKAESEPPVNGQDTASAHDSKPANETKDFNKERKSSATKNNEKSKSSKEPSHSLNVNYKFKNCNVVNVGPQRKNIVYLNHFQNHNSPQNNGTKKEFKEMSAQIQKLSKSEKEITIEDMLLVKIHLGKWKEVAEKLDFSEGEIEQLYEDYKSLNITEVVYQMLIKWHQKNSKAASIGRLVSVMWSCQAYDCVEKLAQSHCDRENTPKQI